jgi:CheY-like chemotaxis protein
MFQLRCEQKGLSWRLEIENSGSPLLVHGDESKLRQILINLLSNAVKFTESGEVTLRVTHHVNGQEGKKAKRQEGKEDVKRITHHIGFDTASADFDTASPTQSKPQPKSLFTFEVIDTGVGISPEERKSIFETFQQGENGIQKGGTGLGLAISKRQVELMGGKLSVESPFLNSQSVGERRGGGSRFFFTVPLQKATVERAACSFVKSQITRLADGYSVKALVADDNKENRDVFAQILSHIGVEVILAENGLQALEAVRVEIPNIVFMDIRMPTMDGLEATRRIFQQFGRDKLKIVAVSASALEHEREEFMAIGFDTPLATQPKGFDDFIAKPVHAERVYECLANLLRVEYEYDDVETQPMFLMDIVLPEELLKRLREAAEFGRITELRESLDEVRQIGAAGHLLAEQILKWSRKFDMDAIRAAGSYLGCLV